MTLIEDSKEDFIQEDSYTRDLGRELRLKSE